MKNKNIPLILRELRAQKKVKQNEVALAIGVTSSAMSAYEKGVANPTLEKLNALAAYYNVSLDYFQMNEVENQVKSSESVNSQLIEEYRATIEKLNNNIDRLLKMLEREQEENMRLAATIQDLGKLSVGNHTLSRV